MKSVEYSSLSVAVIVSLCLLGAGCSPSHYRERSDQTAYTIIKQKQQQAFGHAEEFTIESPEETLRWRLLLDQQLPYADRSSLGSNFLKEIDHWPEKQDHPVPDNDSEDTQISTTPATPISVSLFEALQIGARNSREYQTRKEDLFRKALDLDFERDAFRNTLSGQFDGQYTQDRTNAKNGVVSGNEGSTAASVSRTLLNGATFTAKIGFDLVQMLQPSRLFSRSFFGDASITIPLLRGSGRHIITEPLTQAEREMLYGVWDFERYKKEFVTDLIDSYLAVLKSEDQVRNLEENYRGLIRATRRAGRLAEAGKTPQIQVDQAIQNELRARDRWIASRQTSERDLDLFTIKIGLPPDADLQLDRDEFNKLKEYISNRLVHLFNKNETSLTIPLDLPIVLVPPAPEDRGPLEQDQGEAIRRALANRLDLRIKQGQVYDAQRKVIVAADQLRPELSLFGSVNIGERRSLTEAFKDNSSQLDFSNGIYTGLLTLDLPLERTAEANAYRDSYISLERAVREVQEIEDQIKLQIRNSIRDLEQSRASLKIQYQAVKLADRRVYGASLNLEAGRAEIRDLLEAQEALLSAQNSFTAAMVDYRIAEIRMQTDLGILQVDSNGLWHEQIPRENSDAITP